MIFQRYDGELVVKIHDAMVLDEMSVYVGATRIHGIETFVTDFCNYSPFSVFLLIYHHFRSILLSYFPTFFCFSVSLPLLFLLYYSISLSFLALLLSSYFIAFSISISKSQSFIFASSNCSGSFLIKYWFIGIIR